MPVDANGGGLVPVAGALPARGLYTPSRIRLLLSDPLRLFVVSAVLRDTGSWAPVLRRLPDEAACAGSQRPVAHGDGQRREWVSRERSDELIEARPYVPGDDTRRINWKAYAHSGDLFVRIGEELPPPSRSVILVLRALPRHTEAELDRLISQALAAADELERDGARAALVLDGPERRSLGRPARARRVLAALAAGGRLLPRAEQGLPPAGFGMPAAGPALVLQLDEAGQVVARSEQWQA